MKTINSTEVTSILYRQLSNLF